MSAGLLRALKAYELLVRAKLSLRRGEREGPLIAEKLLQEAVKLDPGFAEPYAYLALAQYRQFSSGIAGDQVRKASLQNARHALMIDPTVTAARRALIAIFHSTGQAEEGLKEAAILRQFGAADSDSLYAIGQAYLRGGMPDRSIPLYQQAIEADPENAEWRCALSMAANWARQYDLGFQISESAGSKCSFQRMVNALGMGKHAVARSAAYETMRTADAFTFAICFATLQEIGDVEMGRQIWRARAGEFESQSAHLPNERVRTGLGIIYALLGKKQEAIEQVRLALEVNPGDPWTLFYSSETYGLVGEDEQALDSLRRAVNRGFLANVYLDQQFAHRGRGLHKFRNDPRFRAERDRLAAEVARLRAQY